jgi:hypothetical protein
MTQPLGSRRTTPRWRRRRRLRTRRRATTFYLHIIETVSREAVPPPRDILDAERDLRWVVNWEAGTIEPLER